MKNELYLVEPNILYKEQFRSMVSIYEKSGETDYFEMYKEAINGFEQYVTNLLNYAKGIDVPDDWVPYNTYWLTNDMNEILGVIRIRTSIDNEYVRKYAGHIGYDISPFHRKQGYGKEILRLGLIKARALGLDKVLVTCFSDNNGSIKIIENNRGALESEIFKENDNKLMRRYWINT